VLFFSELDIIYIDKYHRVSSNLIYMCFDLLEYVVLLVWRYRLIRQPRVNGDSLFSASNGVFWSSSESTPSVDCQKSVTICYVRQTNRCKIKAVFAKF